MGKCCVFWPGFGCTQHPRAGQKYTTGKEIEKEEQLQFGSIDYEMVGKNKKRRKRKWQRLKRDFGKQKEHTHIWWQT